MVALQRTLDKSVQRTLNGVLALLGSLLLTALSLLASSHWLNGQLATVYADRVVPLQQLQRIAHHINVELPAILSGRYDDKLVVDEEWSKVMALWQAYLQTRLTDDEAALAEHADGQLQMLRQQLDRGGLRGSGIDYQQALMPLNSSLAALAQLQVRVADETLSQARRVGGLSWIGGLGLLALGLGLLGLTGLILARHVIAPIRATARCVAGLAAGQEAPIPPQLAGDFAEVGEQLRALRSFIAERDALLQQEQRRSELLRNTQAELVEAEKLASLGGLVAGVAHELNTPIGVAVTVASTLAEKNLGFAKAVAAGTLKRSAMDGFVSDLAQGMDLLERNLQRAAALVRSFKQVAVDRSSMQRRRFDLAEVVDEVLASLRPVYGRGPVQISSSVPPGHKLDSYPGALGQVLNNLVANAALHGVPGGGRIEVSLLDAGAQALQIAVSDDGCGIAPELQAKVFEPFYTTRLGSGGSGLGLSIVRNLVMGVLGGRISLNSQPGQGSRFVLNLPVEAPHNGATPAAPHPQTMSTA